MENFEEKIQVSKIGRHTVIILICGTKLFELADQCCCTQSVSVTELHALTVRWKGNLPSRRKKGQIGLRCKGTSKNFSPHLAFSQLTPIKVELSFGFAMLYTIQHVYREQRKQKVS